MTTATRVGGVPALLAALAGLLIWALHFTLVYAANAIACERELAGARLFGLPALPSVVLGVTALALAALGVFACRAWRRLDGVAVQEQEDMPRFTAALSFGASLLAALAILWEGLVPVLLLPRPCG